MGSCLYRSLKACLLYDRRLAYYIYDRYWGRSKSELCNLIPLRCTDPVVGSKSSLQILTGSPPLPRLFTAAGEDISTAAAVSVNLKLLLDLRTFHGLDFSVEFCSEVMKS